MTARRPWGSVEQLSSGRWRARLPRPARTPAPVTFRTRAEALRWLRHAEVDLERGSWVDPTRAARQTVGEWLDDWLSRTRISKRPGSVRRDAGVIAGRIKPALGDVTLAGLSRKHVQNWIASMSDEGLRASTIRAHHAVLRAALNEAVTDELIAKSPAVKVHLPKLERTEIVRIGHEDVEALADAVGPDYRALVFLAARCGLRFAEVAGLRVGRVKLLERHVEVSETAPQVGPDSQPTKSKASDREVPMPPIVADEIAAHLARRGLTAADGDERVFVAARGGRLHAGNWHGDVWSPARTAAGLPTIRFHDLRHAAVPAWIDAGADLLMVSQWLGHASVAFTADRYGSLFEKTKEEVIERLDESMAEARDARTRADPG